MRRLLFIFLIILLILFGFSFASLNPEPATVRYYFGDFTLPLSLLLALVLTLGAVLGILATLAMWLREKAHSAHLLRRVSLSEKEIRNLREIPLKDRH